MPAEVLAILAADIHLQHLPPPARAGEESWYGAMARPLGELGELANDHKCPVLVAGDVFDKWHAPPELISFAIEYLPQPLYAVVGNHDLPYHSHEELHRSAYWTCCRAGVIRNLQPGFNRMDDNEMDEPFWVWAFPYGHDLEPGGAEDKEPGDGHLDIAVVHDYLWRDGTKHHPDAPIDKILNARRPNLRGYDAALFGDNHVPFDEKIKTAGGPCHVFNAGSLMCRHSDQIDHKPSVGLLLSDGTIRRHYLDISRDVFNPVPNEATPRLAAQAATDTPDMRAFLAELAGLGEGGLDFREAVKRHLAANPPSRAAARLLLESLESSK